MAFGQDRIKSYVQKHSVEVQHINFNDSTFEDLEPIGKAIGDTRIVALGEQMHGDGTAFEAKSRIVKFLHEKKGFNVLVFENDFFGLTYGFEKAQKSKDSLNNFIFHNVIGLWSWCHSMTPLLYSYVYQTQSTPFPLILAGMDCQFQSKYTFENLELSVKHILSKIIESKQDSIDAKDVVDNLSSLFHNNSEANLSGCENGILAIDNLLKGKSLSQLNNEEINIINNVSASYKNLLPYLQEVGKNSYNYLSRENQVHRDRQMFNNLMWLLKYKFPNEKIIIWAHNSHISKSIYDFEDNKNITSMTGELLGNKKINPYSYYSLGFTSYNATSIWTTSQNKPEYTEKPAKNSFETWINKDWNFAFLDWKNWNETHSEKTQFSMKGSFPMTQHRNFIYQWNKVFDGVFFIRNLEGCQKISYEKIIADKLHRKNPL